MSEILIASLAVGVPSVIVAGVTFVASTNAARASATATRISVDAAANERVRPIYEGAILALQGQVADLQGQVKDLETQVAALKIQLGKKE